jgi:invasion protein IalB
MAVSASMTCDTSSVCKISLSDARRYTCHMAQTWLCKLAPVMLSAALLCAGEAVAQQEGGKKPPGGTVPKAQTPAPTNPEAGKKATGAGEPQAQPVSVVGTFGQWMLVCANIKDSAGEKPCSLAQALVERESQKLVFRVIFTYGPQGNLVLQVDGPTGIALQRGLEFSPDAKKIYRLPFQTCVPRGCRAVLMVENALKEELKTSKKGTISVYALNGRAVQTVTDFAGLNDGLAALGKRRSGKGG